MSLPPDVDERLGRYRLLGHLASGGMGEVFLAESDVGRPVVIKRVHPRVAANPEFTALFLREAAIAVRMNHGNLAQVFDFGEADGTYYLAMEHIEGPTLAEVISTGAARGERLSFEMAAYIVAEAARGLAYAHAQTDEQGQPLGIIHRDVSPQNVMLTTDGEVKVIDFGVAKAAALQQLTRPGRTRGKVAFFPPEQIRGETLDARADIYAFGVVLYLMLTGRTPYGEKGDLQLFDAILAGGAAHPHELDPTVPEALSRITMRAMARDRADRFHSAAQLEEELGAWLRVSAPAFGPEQVRELVGAVPARSTAPASTTTVEARVRSRTRWVGLGVLGAALLLAGALVVPGLVPRLGERGANGTAGDEVARQRVEQAAAMQPLEAPPAASEPVTPVPAMPEAKPMEPFLPVPDHFEAREDGSYTATFSLRAVAVDIDALKVARVDLDPSTEYPLKVVGKLLVGLEHLNVERTLFTDRIFYVSLEPPGKQAGMVEHGSPGMLKGASRLAAWAVQTGTPFPREGRLELWVGDARVPILSRSGVLYPPGFGSPHLRTPGPLAATNYDLEVRIDSDEDEPVPGLFFSVVRLPQTPGWEQGGDENRGFARHGVPERLGVFHKVILYLPVSRPSAVRGRATVELRPLASPKPRRRKRRR